MIISGSDGGRGNKKEINPLSIIDRPFNEKETHNTQKIIAEETGVVWGSFWFIPWPFVLSVFLVKIQPGNGLGAW